jgi:hypothetical protein
MKPKILENKKILLFLAEITYYCMAQNVEDNWVVLSSSVFYLVYLYFADSLLSIYPIVFLDTLLDLK